MNGIWWRGGSRRVGDPWNGIGGLIVSVKSEKGAEKNDRIQQLINYGAEIAGATIGGASGFLAGGPAVAGLGAAGGAVVAIVLRNVGQEILERQLGPREKVRMGAAFTIAVAEICRRLESGERPREDGFFDKNQTGRSDAEEVTESVLLKVQREPEEKKIQYMGYLLSSIAFSPQISVHMAHQLTKVAEQLTYRQLCILKLCAVKDDFGLRNESYRGQKTLKKELYQVLDECCDLQDRRCIHFGSPVVFGFTAVVPGNMIFQGLGSDLFNLMKLSFIPDEDVAPIAEQLK